MLVLAPVLNVLESQDRRRSPAAAGLRDPNFARVGLLVSRMSIGGKSAFLPGITTSTERRAIDGHHDDGESKRLLRFSRHLGLRDSSELRLAQLAVHWRNRVVHSSASGGLDGDVRGASSSAAQVYFEEYQTDTKCSSMKPAGILQPSRRFFTMTSCHRLAQAFDAAVLGRINLVEYADRCLRSHLTGMASAWPSIAPSHSGAVVSRWRKRDSAIFLVNTASGRRRRRRRTRCQGVVDEFAALSVTEARARFV